MKTILTTLAVGSVIVIGGCKKTKTVAIATTATAITEAEPIELDVNVEVDNGEIVVMVNGEERSIGDLAELMSGIDFGGGDETIEVHIAKMMGDRGEGGGHPMIEMMMGDDGPPTEAEPIELDVNVEVDNGEIVVMVNGEERSIGDLAELMSGIDFGGGDETIEVHIAKMMGDRGEGGGHPMIEMMMGDRGKGGGHPKVQMMMGDRGKGGGHPKVQMMMGDRGKGGGPPEGMREHRMQRMGEDGDRGEWREDGERGEWREHDEYQDVPEEHQFIEELSMLHEISNFMTAHSMSMLGIHMIRDELEPEKRIEVLEKIIKQTDEGSISRNAALIVAIETLQELDRQEEAAELMVELVVSN